MTNDTNIDEINNSASSSSKKNINPVAAVLVAIIIALTISAVNLYLFINSDMYEKVKLIQNPEVIKVELDNIDTTSVLTLEDLNVIKRDIDSRFELLRDENDYSIDDVSEVSLGL
jgi:hypothetical protein